MSDPLFSDYDKAFYKDGYRLAAALEVDASEEMLLQAIATMYTAVDDLIDSLLVMAQKQNVSVDCKKGCSFCCQQAVYANSYEIHYLGNHIQKHLPKELQKKVMDRAVSKNERVSQLSEEKILLYKSPCPLLNEGACLAYKARPMACRIYLSQSLLSCLEFFKNPTNPDNYPALLEFPLRAGRMMNEGFMAALKEKGIATAEFRIEEGLLHYFK